MSALAKLRWPFIQAAVITLAVACALELLLALKPSYDPYGWLVWGRQTIHWALYPAGAPSWKPLTWLLTTPLTLFGDAAPTLWLIVACAGGLATLWLAYMLAARLAGPLAGASAVIAVLLCREWTTNMLTGTSETFTAALALGALERGLAGRSRLALALASLAALARPECGLALAAYLVWLWRKEPRMRLLIVGVAVALPLLWFLPPYVALGHRFNANDPVFHVDAASHNPFTVAYRGATILIWPVAIAALLGFVVALRDGGARRRVALVLAGGAGAWTTGTVLMAVAGFPGLQRFMLPAAAAACVLAGAGASCAVGWVRAELGAGRRLVPLAAVLLVGAFSGWYAHFRVVGSLDEIRHEQARSELVRGLGHVVLQAGGARRLLACGAPSADLGFQSTLGWYLDLSVGAVGYRPARDLRRHSRVVLFSTNEHDIRGRRRTVIARAGAWRVIGVRVRAGCLQSVR